MASEAHLEFIFQFLSEIEIGRILTSDFVAITLQGGRVDPTEW